MEDQHQSHINQSNLKLQTLKIDEIQSFVRNALNNYELPKRLFPSPYGPVDIMASRKKILFSRLEHIEPSSRTNLIIQLFSFCYKLRNNTDILDLASSLVSYKSSFNEKIIGLKDQLAQKENDSEESNNLQTEIAQCEKFSNLISSYNIRGVSWLFTSISNFLKLHEESYSTEQLIWSFCTEYFEDKDLDTISSAVKEETGIELVNDHKYNFPYKFGVPIKAHIPIEIDEAYFTDCVEVSILHFFYMTQPRKLDLILNFWDDLNSPLKEEVKNFFQSQQGPKRANNDNVDVRQAWGKIVSRIQGQVYKKKSNQLLSHFDVELKAGWFNYLKVIAYLKNDQQVLDELNKYCNVLTEENKILPEIVDAACNCFIKLAGEKLVSAEWIDGSEYEGIRDMEDGSLDLLGTIKCSFTDVKNPIGFVMMDGHGFVDWMENI